MSARVEIASLPFNTPINTETNTQKQRKNAGSPIFSAPKKFWTRVMKLYLTINPTPPQRHHSHF